MATAAALRSKLSQAAKSSTSNNESAADALRQRLKGGPGVRRGGAEHVEILSAFDEQGRRLHSLESSSALEPEDLRTGKRRGKLKKARDEEQGLDAMVAQEREGGVDMDEVFARNIVRLGAHFKGTETGPAGSRAGFDEEEDVDTKMFETQEARVTAQRYQEQQRRQAVKAHEAWQTMMHTNPLSMENPKFKRHLVVATGTHAYLMLRTERNLDEAHCLIVPIRQTPSTRASSEDSWEEIQNFKSSLRRLFGSLGKGVLFMEYALRGTRHWGHVEVIPVPLEVELDASLYFKKALSDVDEEWSTHKKLIDTAQKGLRRAIPEGFPYFHIEWARGGYAHIIEDEEKFPKEFGTECCAGMMGLDMMELKRRRRPSMQEESERVRTLTQKLKPFSTGLPCFSSSSSA